MKKKGRHMFDFDMNVEFLRMAMWQIVLIAGPILGLR